MILEDIGWFLMNFRNHDFSMILPNFDTCITWRRVLRTLSLFKRECPKSDPFWHNISRTNLVRSTLLQVACGSQSGQRGFLLSAFRRPLWRIISGVNLHQMNHFRHQSPWFLTHFKIVSTFFHENDGIIRNIGTFGQNHEKSWKNDDNKINLGSFTWCLGVIWKP